MQRNASLKKESEVLKPPAVEVHEKEKQYDCGICHETFDEVPLFKAHARSVHAGHKAPFYTISNKEKGKSVKAPPFSTPVDLQTESKTGPMNFNLPTEQLLLDLPTESMQHKLKSNTGNPDITYSHLITEALVNSPGLLNFSDICKAISAKHRFYKLGNQKWQSEIMYELKRELNKKFFTTRKGNWLLVNKLLPHKILEEKVQEIKVESNIPMESMPLNLSAEEIKLDCPTGPLKPNFSVVPMQMNLTTEPNVYQNLLDYEEKKLPSDMMAGNLPMPLDLPTDQIQPNFPKEPIQFDSSTVPMQLNLPTVQNDYQSSNFLDDSKEKKLPPHSITVTLPTEHTPYLPMESIQLDLPTDPLQLNLPKEPMQLNLPTVPIQYNLPTETNALHLQNARPCGENMDYLHSESVADFERKYDSVNEIIETNFEEPIEPLKKQYRGKLCCVDNCRNREGMVKLKTVSVRKESKKEITYVKVNVKIGFFKLHRRNQSQFDSWMQAINKRNPDGTPWVPGQHAKICGEHFKSGKPSTSIESPDYVPSLFLPRKLDPPRKLEIVANYDGKKPFKCDICSARYTTKENLNRHFLIEHD